MILEYIIGLSLLVYGYVLYSILEKFESIKINYCQLLQYDYIVIYVQINYIKMLFGLVWIENIYIGKNIYIYIKII